ncbi:putative mitochondrial protein AtMg00710 [Nicotiana tabacum]|uniref:Mitochondrial protein AtMg00710 n=1 Tax=Nicotiana tabacum TaxID=4097 RepID=A0AC58UHS1_TOBAC
MFDEFYNENCITHNFSTPRTPQQNGVVERKNRTLEEIARTMLIDSGIAKNFKAEAINTAYYLVNRCMIRSLLNKTPYDLLNGRKPKLTHLRIFGCKCYVLNNSKAYKIYNKRTYCVEESVHVIFDESYLSCEKINKDDQDGEPLLVPGEVIDITNGKAYMMSQVKEPSEDNAISSASAREEPYHNYNY